VNPSLMQITTYGCVRDGLLEAVVPVDARGRVR